MANALNELQILEKEKLSKRDVDSGKYSETSAFQFENGTRIYYYRGDYGTWNCSVNLPNGSRESIKLEGLFEKYTYVDGPYGNAIYMRVEHPTPYKIMKGVWTDPTTITFSHIRTVGWIDKTSRCLNEKYHKGIGISRWHEGKGYAYRPWDDPIRDAILIDCPLEKMRGLELFGIHKDVVINEIIGIVEGRISMICRTENYAERYLITAQLPDGYFDQNNVVIPRMPNNIDQMNATLTELQQRDKAQAREMGQLQKRINGLEAANRELTQKVEENENQQAEATTEENRKLKEELEEVTRKYRKLLMMSGREEK